MGFFTEQIAHHDLNAIGMTNAPACVSPPGGTQAVLGTNPIAVAVPDSDGGLALQFDQSTSAIAIGKIRVATVAGEKFHWVGRSIKMAVRRTTKGGFGRQFGVGWRLQRLRLRTDG